MIFGGGWPDCGRLTPDPLHLARYLSPMSDETRVLYNETCPVCRFEIDSYRRSAAAQGLPIRFDTLDTAEDWGLTQDQAARQLHVWQNGRVLSGLDAFRALWSALPRWRWLSRGTGWPLIHPLSAWAYSRIAAPLLYRAHLRRQRR
jgi:predicted DCC family thiol-disulfide oxidoreductase YuxK